MFWICMSLIIEDRDIIFPCLSNLVLTTEDQTTNQNSTF